MLVAQDFWGEWLVRDQSTMTISPAGDRRLASSMVILDAFGSQKPEATGMYGGKWQKRIICAQSCHALMTVSIPFFVAFPGLCWNE